MSQIPEDPRFIVGFFHSDILFEQVQRDVSRVGLKLVRIRWTDVAFRLSHRVVLVEAGRDGLPPALREGSAPRDIEVLVVAPHANVPINPVTREFDESTSLCIYPFERDLIARTILRSWAKSLEVRLSRALGDRQCSLVVRCAVRAILRQRPSGWEPGSGRGGAMGPGTLQWMAEAVGCSTDHLSRTAKAVEVDLKEINDWWRVVLATTDRQLGETWERVALRLGFSGVSGLNALLQRTVGCPPTSWGSDGLGELGLPAAELVRRLAGNRIW